MKMTFAVSTYLMLVLLSVSAGCAPVGAAARPSDVSTPGSPVSHSASQGDQPVTASNLPTGIAGLHPEDGGQACLRPQIGVDLFLTDLMRKGGSFDPSTVTLTLDGEDVTSTALVRQTMTFPASRATLLYTPTKDLAVGTHQAAIMYPSAAGPTTYQWSFIVAEMPCP